MSSNNNEKDEISIKGTLKYEDFKKHNSYHQKKIVTGYFVFTILLFMFLIGYNSSGNWNFILPIVTFISFFPAVILTVLLVLLMKLRTRKEYKSDQIIKNEISYVINSDGINQRVRKSNAYIEWNDILVAYEHKDMFRLYISKHKAMILPKRFFNSKEDINALKTFIKENLDSKKVEMS